MSSPREGSNVVFETADGRFALQLRDDRPDVSFANHWGLFGGWCEPDETPEQTILREIPEELGLPLDPSQLRYLGRHQDGNIVSHVFHYPATEALLSAPVAEGQRLELMRLSDLDQHQCVPRHYDILAWYARQKTIPSPTEVP